MTAPLYVALLHYPMTNRRGELVATAVTNLDIHDIARSCRTYDVKKYFIVTPVVEQHRVVGRILAHWQKESNREYHPWRVEALSRCALVHTFEDVKQAILEAEGEAAEVVLTDARPLPNAVTYAEYRRELESPGRTKPACLVFGTGFGVAEIFHPEVHRILTPVYGPKDQDGSGARQGGEEKRYNHLSVRAAAAIILDRLRGN